MEAGRRRDRLTTELGRLQQETLEVSVSDPRQGRGIVPRTGRSWLYTIHCIVRVEGRVAQRTSVERQSRDFSLLLGTLLDLFPGIVLPALPREHTRTIVQSGRAKEHLLLKRSVTFDYFVKYLADHSLVGRLSLYRSFLTSPLKFSVLLENGQHTKAKECLDAVVTRHLSSGYGWQAWKPLDWFVEEVLGVNLNFCLAEDKELVDSLGKISFNSQILARNQKALGALKATLKRMERRHVVMSEWHQELSHLFSSLSLTEQTALEKAHGFNRKQELSGGRLSAFASSAHESEASAHFYGQEEVASVFAQVAEKATSQALSYDKARQDLKERVLFMLAFEILCCEGLYDQLCAAREKLQTWESYQQRLSALRREAEREKAPKEQRLKALLQQIEQLEKEERIHRRIATHWSRAVLLVESRQVRESRSRRMSLLCQEYSKLQTSSGQLTKNIWSTQVEAAFAQPTDAPFGIAIAEPVGPVENGIPADGRASELARLEALLRQKETELQELRRMSMSHISAPEYAPAA